MADVANSDQNATDSLAYKAPRATFLVFFILSGVIGNILVIICILCNPKIRRLARFIFTFNIAIVNIIECLVNVSIQLADVVSSLDLKEADVVCRANAFFLNIVWIEGMLLIFFISLERMGTFKQNSDGKEILQSPWRILVVIVYTWVHSALFSLPLGLGMVPVSMYSDISTCSIAQSASIVYISTLAAVCFVIPLVITIIFFVLTIRLIFQRRRPMKAIITRKQYSSEDSEQKYEQEMNGTKLAFAVFICWLLSVGSFVSVLFVNLYQLSSSENKSRSIVYMFFLWVKYLFVIIFPILTIFTKKEMWIHLKDLICKKSNPVVGVANSHYGNEDIEIKKRDLSEIESIKNTQNTNTPQNTYIHSSGFQVPVLFAMSNGVHIQTYGQEDEMSDSYVIDDLGVRGKKLDVLGSQHNLHNIQTDTSDYDSGNEADPFSVSHPVSSKSAGPPADVLQRRSNSQPEVRSKRTKKRTPTTMLVSVSVASATDSGVDVSMLNKVSSMSKSESSDENMNKHSLTRTMSSKNVLLVNDNAITVLTDSDSTQKSNNVEDRHKEKQRKNDFGNENGRDIITELIENPQKLTKKKKRKKNKKNKNLKLNKDDEAVDQKYKEIPKSSAKLSPKNFNNYILMRSDSDAAESEKRICTSGSVKQNGIDRYSNDITTTACDFTDASKDKIVANGKVSKSPLKSIMKKKLSPNSSNSQGNVKNLDLMVSKDVTDRLDDSFHESNPVVTTPSSCRISLEFGDAENAEFIDKS